ncbi:MAG: sulfur carrier protein ThiS adenylyltransferase ThiF [Deltaproteobacteria bacterium]|jgi:sulfur carrier protein ThiS adenylyltransferase|nr:sulfur carrier protein ThiS adenylyltransferase ThiF [Deltaproteobacteria bacterium]
MPTPLQAGLSRYWSPEQLSRLAAVRVGVAGAGGLGSNCAMLLVRSGVRAFTLADFDRVEASNLNRQFYFSGDIGQSKVEALGRNLRLIDAELELRLLERRLAAEDLPALYADCPVVVEALDRAEYKAMFCNAMLRAGKFLVSASGLGGIGGLSEQSGRPAMRARRLGPNFVCVGDFSTESNAANPPLAPRVVQAAAMQADLVLDYILNHSAR